MQLTDENLKNILKASESDIEGYKRYADVDFHWRNTVAFIGNELAKEAFNGGKNTLDDARSVGKALGLAFCYGASKYTVKKAYPDKSEKECERLVQNFFNANKKLKKHLENLMEDMHKNGYIKTILGRKIPVENWNVMGNDYESRRKRNKAENNASNYPIQGAGGEVVRIMSIAMGKWIEKNNLYRMQHNNVTKDYAKRIVTIDVSIKDTDSILAELDQQPNGNTMVLVTDGSNVVGEYDRYIAFSPNKLPDYKIYF